MNLQLRRSRRSALLSGCLAVALAISSLAQTTAPATANDAPPAHNAGTAVPVDQSRYVISPGDVLDISVYGVPDLSQKARVGSTGSVNLPLVNSVRVGGLHVEDAQAKIERALSDGNFLKNPHVNVAVAEYGSGAEVMGEVAHPGTYPVLGSRRLLELLSAAGGTTSSAGRAVTITHRADGELRTVYLSNDPKQLLTADVLVYQGDTVLVSRAGVIYVVGEVLSPSGFVMENKTEYTALRAMAMAHGATKYAKLSQARIVRQTPKGLQEIPVPLDKVVQSKSPDVPMQAEDILYVPTSRGKVAAARTADVAISLASGLAILGVSRR